MGFGESDDFASEGEFGDWAELICGAVGGDDQRADLLRAQAGRGVGDDVVEVLFLQFGQGASSELGRFQGEADEQLMFLSAAQLG